MRFIWIIVLLVAGIACWTLTSPAGAAPAPSSAPVFAMVDMEKVVSGYEAFRNANEEYRRYFVETERQLEATRRQRLLTDKEVQELKDLRAAVALNPERKMRLQELESLSDAREQELVALEQKSGQLSPEEKARREELLAIAAKRAPEISAEEKRVNDARQKKNEDMSAPFNQSIKEALEKVAKDNRVSVLFTKDVVLWASLDLTDMVLAELNRPAKAEKSKGANK
jgi:Skp family chaperone for outer membrane proteins